MVVEEFQAVSKLVHMWATDIGEINWDLLLIVRSYLRLELRLLTFLFTCWTFFVKTGVSRVPYPEITQKAIEGANVICRNMHVILRWFKIRTV